jgi:hypothetical protein
MKGAGPLNPPLNIKPNTRLKLIPGAMKTQREPDPLGRNKRKTVCRAAEHRAEHGDVPGIRIDHVNCSKNKSRDNDGNLSPRDQQ